MEEYLAFDPNLTLQAGHALSLRNHATSQQQQNFSIRYEPFESSNLSAEDFSADLVFTSPPFFNLEVYTTAEHSKGQSILRAIEQRGGHAMVAIDIKRENVAEYAFH